MISSLFERFLPRRACNDYRGSKISRVVFGLVSLVMMGRSLIHLSKDDAGANSSP